LAAHASSQKEPPEAALDWTSKPWDLAPLGVIVEEAAGKSTNVRGERTIYTGNF